jgi:hypothetical protein
MENKIQNITAFLSGPRQFDLIGDIHGYADDLERLLLSLGYERRGGSFAHPAGRRLIFLGDYIDRGPDIRRVLRIVRGLVEDGIALAIAGNHEVNALCYDQRDEEGGFLKARTERNQKTHQATLDQIAKPFPREWEDWLAWFRDLPLFLDLGDLRAVHASWDPAVIASFSGIDVLSEKNLRRFGKDKSPGKELLSQLINGPEAELPDGRKHRCADGAFRSAFRIRWWKKVEGQTCADLIFPRGSGIPQLVPAYTPEVFDYDQDQPPVFFGHYAIIEKQPALQAANVACLDYGIGKGGFLAAYRWNGEQTLDEENFRF